MASTAHTALLVTRDADIALMLRHAFDHFGLQQHTARTLDEALASLRAQKARCTVVDLHGESDAQAATSALRLERAGILVALAEHGADQERIYAAGATFVLQRSNFLAEMVACLRATFSSRPREARLRPRLPISASVEFDGIERSLQCAVLNVSDGGMCVAASSAQIDRPIRVRLDIPGTKRPLVALARPVWSESSRVGLQFGAMPRSARLTLRGWLRAESGESLLDNRSKAAQAVKSFTASFMNDWKLQA
jgi:ActR/RegA family two-component response regulator